MGPDAVLWQRPVGKLVGTLPAEAWERPCEAGRVGLGLALTLCLVEGLCLSLPRQPQQPPPLHCWGQGATNLEQLSLPVQTQLGRESINMGLPHSLKESWVKKQVLLSVLCSSIHLLTWHTKGDRETT